jgi:hypothetical protein
MLGLSAAVAACNGISKTRKASNLNEKDFTFLSKCIDENGYTELDSMPNFQVQKARDFIIVTGVRNPINNNGHL